MRWVLLLLAGCGRIGFGELGDDATDAHAHGDGAIGDGAIVGGDGPTALGCVSPGDGDAFSGSTPCSGWGAQIMTQSALQEANGKLLVVPTPTVSTARGGCKRPNTALTDAGVFVEISRVLDQGNTELSAATTNGTFAITISTGVLELSHGADVTTVPYDAITMRWLRMRPSGGQLVFETSADGHTWRIRRTLATAVPTMADVTIDAFTPGVLVSPGIAQFEGIDVCPP